jgi:hypothetical protein
LIQVSSRRVLELKIDRNELEFNREFYIN